MGSESKINLGISMGDPNGIGLEIILKIFEDRRMFDFFTPVLFAPLSIVKDQKEHYNLHTSIHSVSNPSKLNRGKLNLIPIEGPNHELHFGEVDPQAGVWAVASLRAAVEASKKGVIDALVTAPIHKKSIQGDGFMFPGHTQFLAAALETESLMVMVADTLRVALVTDHIPVNEVSTAVNAERIRKTIDEFYHSLQNDFGIPKPKIAVLGMNPHAGDDGVIGQEDDTVIRPVVQAIQEEEKLVYGPYAADSFFGSGTAAAFDGIIAIYHDQGLIPFKTLSFGQGVNFTAGLPLVRTSPDHGTAFDIAGKGRADLGSFKAAMFSARDIFRQRQESLQNKK